MEHITLFSIPWEQVLCKHLLPFFSLKELFILRIVDKQFLQLVHCYFSLVFRINTAPFSSQLSSKAFDILTRNNFSLKELVLCNSRDWLCDGTLVPVLQNNNGLTTIDISHCQALSNASLYTVGAHCRKVKKLIIRGCVWASGAGLISLVSNQLPLEHMDLSGCWDLTDEDVITLTKHSPK